MTDAVEKKGKLGIGLIYIMDQPVGFKNDQQSKYDAADFMLCNGDEINKKKDACHQQQNPENNIKEKPVINHTFLFFGTRRPWSILILLQPY